MVRDFERLSRLCLVSLRGKVVRSYDCRSQSVLPSDCETSIFENRDAFPIVLDIDRTFLRGFSERKCTSLIEFSKTEAFLQKRQARSPPGGAVLAPAEAQNCAPETCSLSIRTTFRMI